MTLNDLEILNGQFTLNFHYYEPRFFTFSFFDSGKTDNFWTNRDVNQRIANCTKTNQRISNCTKTNPFAIRIFKCKFRILNNWYCFFRDS